MAAKKVSISQSGVAAKINRMYKAAGVAAIPIERRRQAKPGDMTSTVCIAVKAKNGGEVYGDNIS